MAARIGRLFSVRPSMVIDPGGILDPETAVRFDDHCAVLVLNLIKEQKLV